MSKRDYTIVNVAIRLIRMISLQFICYNGRQKTCMSYRLWTFEMPGVCGGLQVSPSHFSPDSVLILAHSNYFIRFDFA